MSFVEGLLAAYGIKMHDRSPDVDLEQSTVRTLIDNNAYTVGNFLKRLLKRVDLIDEFRTDYIAYAQYNPIIRKISIVINPLQLWDRILRPTARNSKNKIADQYILHIDKLMLTSLKNGGWTKEAFKEWIEFMTGPAVVSKSHNHYGRDNQFTTTFLSVVIHELLHVVWNHITMQRFDDSGPKEEQMFNQRLSNIAQDFAINQTLSFGVLNEMFMTTVNADLLYAFYDGGAPMAHTPIEKVITTKNITIDDFDDILFLNQPFEFYLDLLKNAKEENLEKVAGKKIPSSMFGQGQDGLYDLFKHVFGEMTEEQRKEMSDAINSLTAGQGEQQFEDFNQMTSDMKKVASNDLKRVIDEMLERGEIDDPREICDQHPFKINGYFAKIIDNLYPTNTMSWEHILAHYIRKALGAEDHSYSMKRESRAVPDMFPGKERHEGLDLNIIIDVSGSINHDEFNRFINEVEKIAKDVDVPYVRYMQFHSTVALDTYVPLSSIRGIGISSTGGTCLSSALDRLKVDGNKTLTVVFTDGHVEDSIRADHYEYEALLFLSSSGRGYAASSLRDRGFKVVLQDGDNSWFNDA